jgi:predicted Kef-type K+ transport protein
MLFSFFRRFYTRLIIKIYYYLAIPLTEVFEILLKIGGFVGLMLLFGRRFLPTILQKVADTDSKELLTLCTLGIALGFAALAYSVFDASFALGAFFAGLVLNESDIGKETAKTTESLRDTFAVLFFVSVGMLFDPMTLINQPVLVLATLAIIVFGKTLAALLITRLFRQDLKTSLVCFLQSCPKRRVFIHISRYGVGAEYIINRAL